MTNTTGPVPLARADDEAAFGGKAAQLAVAVAAGLWVPGGVAVAWPLVDAVAGGDDQAVATLADVADTLANAPPEGLTEARPAAADHAPGGCSLVVRSSVVGEDSPAVSYAGQHLTVVNVAASEVAEAVGAVWRSAHSEAPTAYRRRLGLTASPRVGVVVQRMVHAEVAGVAFRPNPVTGADEVVIEAAWGLGEAVVGGLVTPDRFCLDTDGRLLERHVGAKEVEVVAAPGGGTRQRPTTPDRARAVTLDERRLAEVHRLVLDSGRVYGPTQDVEWALAAGTLWFLQRRAVTGGGRPGET